MIRQLHYTSCEDGLEGIQGFQVSALTPGTPKQLAELAVRASTYEPGPALVGRLADQDLDGFPVAFGYAVSGSGAALFQSRYAGADFTGRVGNYFAHALLFDDAERELGNLLPIDLWRARAWAFSRDGGPELPVVTSLAPGDETSREGALRFATAPDATTGLQLVLSGTQRVLVAGRGRLVLVVPDDRTAALWIAVVCRSLPRPLALAVSFTTYTARPEECGALLGCTTQDVRLPSYGDFTAIDLTGRRPGGGAVTRYAQVISRLWERDEVGSALDLASCATPPLAAAELDPFAVLLEVVLDLPAEAELGEELLLAAVRLAVDRLVERLPEHAWERIADTVRGLGGPVDLAGWSDVLRTALQRGEEVPAKLLGAYFTAALASREKLWLPDLAPAALADVAEDVLLPALSVSPLPAVLERSTGHRPLLDALAGTLELRLADQRELVRLASVAPVELTRVLAAVRGKRTGLLVDLVRARNGDLDPVRVVTALGRQDVVDWQPLGAILWPHDPSAEESVRLLRQVPVDVLVDSGIGARMVARALDRAGRDGLDPKEAGLVGELLSSPVAARLEQVDRAGLDAARRIADLRNSTPGRDAVQHVLDALSVASEAPGEVAHRLVAAAASFVLRATPRLHRDLLDAALDEHARLFLPVYRAAACTRLADAPPREIAGVVAVWQGLPSRSLRERLVEDTLAEALRKRRAKHLDKVGSELLPQANVLGMSAPKPNWPRWWQQWRVRHERRGLLSFFSRRKEA
ncbi:hypothetical protein KCV87_31595 [Actinosynnema pretiosum subsp. pretiosum]|uniref:Uncharacterized protein n=1 Tax=Actinosynnema pretiosum subsp. pretiosum TaxID=103721 RepID=A0AA45R3R5_9PSEU|nr:hypothetical protein KCV87_31595 [Actinosynnema pretiosum subsp. pretiosum]